MEKIELTFEQDRPTKNTVRYQEISESETVVGTLYVQKSALEAWSTPLGAPSKLKVTIEPIPVE